MMDVWLFAVGPKCQDINRFLSFGLDGGKKAACELILEFYEPDEEENEEQTGGDDEETDPTHFQNQQQCDALKSDDLFHYEFNKEACQCFFVFDFAYDPCSDDDNKVFNPMHIPYNQDDLCISTEEYDNIFNHNYNDECL